MTQTRYPENRLADLKHKQKKTKQLEAVVNRQIPVGSILSFHLNNGERANYLILSRWEIEKGNTGFVRSRVFYLGERGQKINNMVLSWENIKDDKFEVFFC